MKFKPYSNPHRVGWAGWIEDQAGAVVAFVHFEGTFLWHEPWLKAMLAI